MQLMRGQTLVETLLVMPIMLFVIFATLYIAHYGIVNERTQIGLRYAGVEAFVQGQTDAYTAADIYSNLSGGTQPVPCPTAPPGVYTNSAPYPGPSSPPLWSPDAPVDGAGDTMTSSCSPTFTDLGGASFLAARFISATQITSNAGVSIPAYLQPLLGRIFTQTNAATAFAHSAYPGIILYCVAKAHDATLNSITANGTVGLPTPMPGLPTAPPANGSGC
ncbi:MAG: TadE/TadG family type IV pilus assembly protein [Vulcanimicrobiaceae bacterium]